MTAAPPLTAPVPRSGTWLLSPAADLVFLYGGVLASVALFALWRGGILSTGELYVLWIFVFHGPHFWATISRTYLDRTEWQARGRVLIGSLGWFLVGPVMVGTAILTGWTELAMLFGFMAALWAYHHVVKQHFGFMALYRARAREFDKREFQFHKYYIIVSLWLPIVILLANVPPFLQSAPYATRLDLEQLVWLRDHVTPAATAAFLALQVLFVGHLAIRLIRGRGVNWRELGIVVCSVPLHWFVVTGMVEPLAGDPVWFLALVPLVTTYHNIQYHALVWHYNRTKYGKPEARERHGLAWWANRNLLVYAALGLCYTLVYGLDQYGLPIFNAGSFATLAPILLAGWWGFSFMHYYLDSKIWHVRHDRDLQRVLGFETQ